MNIDSGALALILTVAGAILTPLAVSIGKLLSLSIQLKTIKLAESNKDLLISCAQTSVYAVEQLAKSGQISPDERKSEAEKIARNLLSMAKSSLDTKDLLSPAIESQVWEGLELSPSLGEEKLIKSLGSGLQFSTTNDEFTDDMSLKYPNKEETKEDTVG